MNKKASPLVAVVTGAASGIGRSLASKCLKEGMCVVLADVEKEALISTSNHFKAIYKDSKIFASVVDVTQLSDVQRLGKEVMERFGKINYLFNNAGVASRYLTSGYKSTIKEWQWIINVNLFGVIHGLQVFVPLMLQQPKDEIMHIVNTSSMAGVVSGANYIFATPYTVSKHAVVALSESLSHELSESSIKVHVLLPGAVQTNILDSYRNCPQHLQDVITEEKKATDVFSKVQLSSFMHPDTVAEKVFDGIAKNHFYIFTHPPESFEGLKVVIERFKDITENRQPKPPMLTQSNSKL